MFYPLFLCAFRTGMRLGEIVGLAWEDIDFEVNTIEVFRSFSHGHWSSPKSHRTRKVDMSNQLKQALQIHHKNLLHQSNGKLIGVKVPKSTPGPSTIHLLFPNRKGQPIDGDNMRHRVYYKILEKAGLARFRFHDIRHTFASLLLQQGESLHYVMEQIGHASIQTTVDVYGHMMPGTNRRAVNELDDLEEPQLRLVGQHAG